MDGWGLSNQSARHMKNSGGGVGSFLLALSPSQGIIVMIYTGDTLYNR